MARFTTIDEMVCEVTMCGNCPFHKDEQDMGAMAEYCVYPTRKGNRIVRDRKSAFPDDCPLYDSRV